MIVKQGNREFIEIVNANGDVRYFVHRIDGKYTIGREGSYVWRKCLKCGRILGTQFNGFTKHTKVCEQK